MKKWGEQGKHLDGAVLTVKSAVMLDSARCSAAVTYCLPTMMREAPDIGTGGQQGYCTK